MAKAIADCAEVEIRGVDDRVQFSAGNKVLELPFPTGQERSDDVPPPGLDPCQSFNTCAVEDADEESLDLIIGMVGGGDRDRSEVSSLRLEGFVSNPAGSDLDTLAWPAPFRN